MGVKWELDLWYEMWDRAGSQGLDTWYELPRRKGKGEGRGAAPATEIDGLEVTSSVPEPAEGGREQGWVRRCGAVLWTKRRPTLPQDAKARGRFVVSSPLPCG